MQDLIEIFERAREVLDKQDIPVDVIEETMPVEEYELLQYVNKRMRGENV
jgi:hypothetical protein